MMGGIDVQEGDEAPAVAPASPGLPPMEAAGPVGTVRGRGRLAHRFHGTYSAAIALEFESLSEARTALGVLGEPWKLSPRDGRFLVCSVDGAALGVEKEKLGRYGADVGAIDSLRKSVDYGEPFTVDVPTNTEAP